MTSTEKSGSALSVETSQLADCRLVGVHGRVGQPTPERFGSALDAAAGQVPGGGGMLLDLAGLAFLTRAGLRSLLLAQRALRAAGASMVVCGSNGVVAEVFRISRLDTLLPVAPSTAQALARISPAAAEAYPG